MIRKELSKLPDSGSMGRAMNYALEKAALIGGSQVKFEKTSIADFVKLGVKKCDKVNNKYENKSGRKQENKGLHEMISFDTDDNLTPEQAAELALSVWRDVLDIDNHEHRWGVHTDTDQIHVHLVWNKRDNAGKIYNQKNDYELFEKALHKTEMANGLKVVEKRKFLKPGMPTNPQPSNEYRLEKRGIKSEKSKFKESVNAATDKAMTAGEFLEFLNIDGFMLINNGNNAYSIEKDGVIFKASDVGASYKALKARFGDDPQFGDTLARLGVKTAPVRDFGSISMGVYEKQSEIDEREFKKKSLKRVLDTRFDTDNNREFFFKDTNKKAFKYDPLRRSVDFNSTSPMAVKAGLQKLTEKGKPAPLVIGGHDAFRREVWLQFHMMNLDKKGYTLEGYSPTSSDKAKLEKMKLENPAFKKPEEKKPVEKKLDNQPTTAGKKDRNSPVDLESFTKFKVSDTQLAPQTGAEKAAQSGVVAVVEGVIKAAVEIFTERDVKGEINEQLSQMRVLDQLIKNNQNSGEDEQHQTKKRRLMKPRPQ